MAFKFANYRGSFSAKVVNDELIVHVAKDITSVWPLPLGEDIPLQTKDISKRPCLFWFENDKHIFVGRANGTYSKYTKDGLLLYTKSWDAPNLKVVGSITHPTHSESILAVPQHNEIMFRAGDAHTCYIHPKHLELESVSNNYVAPALERAIIYLEGDELCDITDTFIGSPIWREK